jgi:class 3 adenylate cyclase
MPATRTSLLTPEADGGMRLWLWIAALALPLLGLVLLLAAPDADVQWEHHPSHFWLVLAAGVTSAALAFSTSAVALRRSDARLYLVSLAFLSAAGFLGLHALSTPGVLLDAPNQGFAVATPIGLLLSSLFAAASALPLRPERARAVMRHAHLLRGVLLGAMAVWAAWSLLSVPPLDDPTPVERATGVLLVVPVVALVLYALAAARYLAMVLHSGSPILLGVTSAWVLLGEASVAVAFGRNWHASWWEWHLLMLVAFGAIAVVARREDAEERFSDLYLDHTAAGTREVSVLFADLAGFTSFSEGRQPREVTEMLNAYFEVAIPPLVREHGGEIDRLIGDAIMATWGTRGDQPDHAERAVNAAATLQMETARLAAEHPDWPRFRAAVNTGEALVGVVGAESGRSYTVIGDTVNVASRLESRAPTGGVVVGGATLRAVPGLRATSLGEVEVKGKRERVDAYLLELRS